jgi:hypothetical protein
MMKTIHGKHQFHKLAYDFQVVQLCLYLSYQKKWKNSKLEVVVLVSIMFNTSTQTNPKCDFEVVVRGTSKDNLLIAHQNCDQMQFLRQLT